PVVLVREALRQAEVRERTRAVFGRLRVDTRAHLRALPGPRAHAEPHHVGIELRAIAVFVFGEQCGVAGQAVVDTHQAARPVVDALALATEARVARAAQRHAAVPHVDARGDERLVGDALVAVGLLVGDVTHAGADAVALLLHADVGTAEQALRFAREHLLVLN